MPALTSTDLRTFSIQLKPDLICDDDYATMTSGVILNSTLDTLPHGSIDRVVDVCVYGDSPRLTGSV
jgi:hypothetical protein